MDGSCDTELSIKGLTSEELIVGDWKHDLPIAKSNSISTSILENGESIEVEITQEDDENSGVFL